MNTKPIYITRTDQLRLKQLLVSLSAPNGKKEAIADLEAELTRATIIDPSSVTENLVTLNSCVTVRDLDTGETESYQVTLPQDAGRGEGVISVLAPIGIALLGYSAGDDVVWETPGGIRRIRIDSVSQGENKPRVIPPYFPEHLLGSRSTA